MMKCLMGTVPILNYKLLTETLNLIETDPQKEKEHNQLKETEGGVKVDSMIEI